jgi:hypothetical protein
MIRIFSIGGARVMVMRLRRSWQRDEYARSLAAELDAHIALHAADRIRQGLSPAEALRDARLHLGGVLQTRERCLDVMTFRWMTRWFGRATRSPRGARVRSA